MTNERECIYFCAQCCSIATVVVFWTFVEVRGRWNILNEIWMNPMEYKIQMFALLAAFLVLFGILLFNASRKKKEMH